MTKDPFDLADRVVLLTGASAGLGAHFAHVIARAGARVVVTARRQAELSSVVRSVRSSGGQALGITANVVDEGSIAAAFDFAEREFGRVNTVVANAGTNASGSAVTITAEAFQNIIATNVTGTFLTARECAKRLIQSSIGQNNNGRILLLSSMTAEWVVKGLAPYSASKAAVNQMCRVLAKDWARHGITVNCLSPGNIATDITAQWFESEPGKRQLESFANRRLMRAHDLDYLLLYLCSSSSAPVTGSIFSIDDGQSL